MRFIGSVLIFLVLTQANATCLWGKKGHRVTGYLAEKHLTRKAKKAIAELLDGHSLAFVATYADEIKSDRKYLRYSPWHYVNYPMDMRYADAEKKDFGDIVKAIAFCEEVLLDPNSTRTDKVFHLKLLVHFIGDLHQPLHVGRAEDRGGNDIQVRWFGDGSNLHRVWDTNLIESYGMAFYELGDELNRSTKRIQRLACQEGTVMDWVEESHTLAADIYASASSGEELGYQYAYKYNGVVFDRLKKGGFRLAKILNAIFS